MDDVWDARKKPVSRQPHLVYNVYSNYGFEDNRSQPPGDLRCADRKSGRQPGGPAPRTQPAAMSYALSKLRAGFNDPLFVRVRNEMLPTPRATQLAAPIRSVLTHIKTEVLQDAAFVPAQAHRTFRLCMSDIGEMVFLPPIIRTFMRAAPHATLTTTTLAPATLMHALEAGDVDVAIGYFPDLQKSGVFQQQLSVSDFVCIARRNNPYVKERLTLTRFSTAPQVSVRAAGRTQELIEKSLAKAGIARRVLATVPHFLSLLELVPKTDLISPVPRVLGETLAKAADIKIYPLPTTSPRFAVKQYWHRRYHRDPANRWIRGIVRELFQ